MYVGGGLFVRWGGGVGGSKRRAHRRRQHHRAPIAWTGLSAGWPLA